MRVTARNYSTLQFCGIALSRRKDSCLRADSDWSEGKGLVKSKKFPCLDVTILYLIQAVSADTLIKMFM